LIELNLAAHQDVIARVIAAREELALDPSQAAAILDDLEDDLTAALPEQEPLPSLDEHFRQVEKRLQALEEHFRQVEKRLQAA
jgi:hypothetical protein